MPLADTECEADALALELREPLEQALEQADALIADEALPQGVGEILALGLREADEQPLALGVGEVEPDVDREGEVERVALPLAEPEPNASEGEGVTLMDREPDVDSDGEPDGESVPEPHCE